MRPDQLDMMDAYDVQILESLRRRLKVKREYDQVALGLPPLIIRTSPESIYMDVHGEMGGITELQIYERLKKLFDMALVRTYVVFNREMPEDLR